MTTSTTTTTGVKHHGLYESFALGASWMPLGKGGKDLGRRLGKKWKGLGFAGRLCLRPGSRPPGRRSPGGLLVFCFKTVNQAAKSSPKG